MMKTALARMLLASSLALPLAAVAGNFSPYVDDKGGISRPTDFRTTFVHLGSYAVLDEKSAAHGLHDVYTERRSAEHYRKTGQFPDGATLVKEIRKLERSAMTTGDPVVWGSDAAIWFVMIKDAKGRFAGNPLWGDGWGWALFTAAAPATNAAISYAGDCQGCHVPAAGTDRVFVQGYPTLHRP
jgi:hypothetical protein